MRNNIRFLEREMTFTDPGSPVHEIRRGRLQDDQTIVLEVVGKENTDDLIESYRDSTELSSIIKRFLNGDESALQRRQGYYADISEYPKTYSQFLQTALDAEHNFDLLPADIREKYGNNWRQWLSQAFSEPWLKDMERFQIGFSEDSESASSASADFTVKDE